MPPEHTIYAFWFGWIVSWTLAMLWSNRTEKRASITAELFFRVLLYFGVILLFAFPPPSNHHFAQMQLWHLGDPMNWILTAITAAGLFFTPTRIPATLTIAAVVFKTSPGPR